MLEQVILPCAIGLGVLDQHAHGIELLETRPDGGALDLATGLFDLIDQNKALQDPQEDFTGKHRFARTDIAVEIGDPEFFFDIRIAGTSIAAAVEWQEACAAIVEMCGHGHVVLIQREMHQGAALESQEGLAIRRAVLAVLLFGCLIGRACQGVLEFHCGKRDAINEEHHINCVLRAQGIAYLTHHSEDIALIGAQHRRVEAGGWLEGAKGDLDARHDGDALAQDLERANGLEAGLQLTHQSCALLARILVAKLLPGLGLGRAHEFFDHFGIEGGLTVKGRVGAFPPALARDKLVDEVGLDSFFGVELVCGNRCASHLCPGNAVWLAPCVANCLLSDRQTDLEFNRSIRPIKCVCKARIESRNSVISAQPSGPGMPVHPKRR